MTMPRRVTSAADVFVDSLYTSFSATSRASNAAAEGHRPRQGG